MARRVQLIRHSTGAADAFVGLQGEIFVDTTKKEFRLGDGLTAGGIPQARADLDNVDGATTSVDGKLVASDKQKLAFLTLTQAVDLDAIEALLAFITVTQNVNLDTIEADVATAAAELAYIAITQAVDLDAIESAAVASKIITDWIAVTQAVDLDTMESNIATNNAKVTNATHSGDMTGSGALTAQPAIISDKTAISTGIAGTDELLLNDAGTLKRLALDKLISGMASALTTGLVGTDEIWVSDNGVLKRMDISVMNAYFNSALVFKAPVKDHGSKSGNYTVQLNEAELHLVTFSANATLTIASTLSNDKATVVIKNNNYTITLAGINNDSPTLTKAASKQDFVGLVKSFGKISAVAFRLNIATS